MTDYTSETDEQSGHTHTHNLHLTYRAYIDTQRLRKMHEQRGLTHLAESVKESEQTISKIAAKEIKKHPLYPWLQQYNGFTGIRMAGVLGMIDNPHRFPGQRCVGGSTQHYFTPNTVSAGDQCPESIWDIENTNEQIPCEGIIEEPRSGTGVRSLWHYAGFHVDEDGKLPRRKKGKQSNWRGELRTCFLMPNGIVDQVNMHQTKKYRGVYTAARERGKEHRVARTIVAKAILGDLLMEWKRITE